MYTHAHISALVVSHGSLSLAVCKHRKLCSHCQTACFATHYPNGLICMWPRMSCESSQTQWPNASKVLSLKHSHWSAIRGVLSKERCGRITVAEKPGE